MLAHELGFNEVWAVDFEYQAVGGNLPVPICLVARQVGTGRMLRIWQDELQQLKAPPYPVGPHALFVAYYASAELGCHLALDWLLPENVLDLCAEFWNLTNGVPVPCGRGLLGALASFGLDAIDAAEKDSMRELAIRGGPWTDAEKVDLLDYCESDVDALDRLFPRILPSIDLPRALLRGRSMKAMARIEHTGVPIDVEALGRLRENWPALRARLIEHVDRDFGIYQGATFKSDRFSRWLAENDIPWPRLPSGALALDYDTFKVIANAHPRLQPLRQLRATLSKLHAFDLPVGPDGRNRCTLWAFSSRTGRNQPKTSEFIFGAPSWLRGLIRPGPGRGVAYIDWSQQEIGIAAALSGDAALIEAYLTGDPYLAFAKQVGAVPQDATKATHGAIREQYKACFLGVQYGMGAESLALRIGQPVARARELLLAHRETYRTLWRWSDSAVDYANLFCGLTTTFGWQVRLGPDTNSRSLRNFPMQANGAEMLRLACIFATERGIEVCAPVHDAIVIEARAEDLVAVVEQAQEAMAQASSIVLDGFRLRSDAKLVYYPDRYLDERGCGMWNTVRSLLDDLGTGTTQPTRVEVDCATVQHHLSAGAHPSPLI